VYLCAIKLVNSYFYKKNKLTFGIPTYLNKTLDYGTEVELQKIIKEYPEGEADIVCVGKRIFRVKKFEEQMAGKLYAGGEVDFLEDNDTSTQELQEELLRNIAILYVELTIQNPPIFDIPFISYQVAHKIGLALHQEYHLLTLRSELERLNYLIGHLKVTIPVVREMNRTKEVIKMNGHIKNFDPLDFEDFKM